MTNERHHELSQQIYEAISAKDDEKVKGLQLTLELEMAECLAHQSDRGKETLAIVKKLEAHSDERDDRIENELHAHISEYENAKAKIEGAKQGASLAVTILKFLAKFLALGGSAGAVAKLMSAFGVG